MRVKVWGARGSVPAPGPETMRYGGNTSCVEVRLSDGSLLVLDAGTGLRTLGLALGRCREPVHVLLTHLHMDHIQGLMFFGPAFDPQSEIVIWGPAQPAHPGAPLRERIARYISAPLSPIEVRELPSAVDFREAEPSEWQIGPATVRAEPVAHRGPTLGYRITDGDDVLVYIPDHEPALGVRLDAVEEEWISGFDLAHGATLLIHDCQYTADEYARHLGWGHCALPDALTFARRAAAERVLLFHHDPLHTDDVLDVLGAEAAELWSGMGGDPAAVELASERRAVEVGGTRAAVRR